MQILWGLETLAQIGVLVVLYRRGLWRSYRALVIYLGITTLAAALMLPLYGNYDLYSKTWDYALPIILLAKFGAVFEIANRTLAAYPHSESWVPSVYKASQVLCALAAFGLLFWEWGDVCTQPELDEKARLMSRWANSMCVLLFAVIGLLRIFMPTPIPRNWVIHRYTLMIFCLAPAIGSFLAPLKTPLFHRAAYRTEMTLEFVCCLSWMLLLCRKNEAPPKSIVWTAIEKAEVDQEFYNFAE